MFVANGYAIFCFKKYSTVNVKGYFGTIISRFSNILKMLRLKKRSTDSLISDFKLFFFFYVILLVVVILRENLENCDLIHENLASYNCFISTGYVLKSTLANISED